MKWKKKNEQTQTTNMIKYFRLSYKKKKENNTIQPQNKF